MLRCPWNVSLFFILPFLRSIENSHVSGLLKIATEFRMYWTKSVTVLYFQILLRKMKNEGTVIWKISVSNEDMAKSVLLLLQWNLYITFCWHHRDIYVPALQAQELIPQIPGSYISCPVWTCPGFRDRILSSWVYRFAIQCRQLYSEQLGWVLGPVLFRSSLSVLANGCAHDIKIWWEPVICSPCCPLFPWVSWRSRANWYWQSEYGMSK